MLLVLCGELPRPDNMTLSSRLMTLSRSHARGAGTERTPQGLTGLVGCP